MSQGTSLKPRVEYPFPENITLEIESSREILSPLFPHNSLFIQWTTLTS